MPSCDHSAIMATPSFPIDALIPWQREMVEAVSNEAQTDPAMAAMFCLGFSSFTVARTVSVAIGSARPDVLALWTIVVASSGEGKSRTFGPLIAPLVEVEETTIAFQAPPPNPGSTSFSPNDDEYANEEEGEHRLTQWARLVSTEGPFETESPRAATSSDASWATLEAVADALRAEQEREHPGSIVAFRQANITPEALLETVATQCLGVLQAAPESYLLSRIAAGSGTAVQTLANYNSMWSGEDIRVRRVVRVASSARRPVLTIVMSPQPAAFEEVLTGRVGKLVERTGFLQRCLLCRPDSNIGKQVPYSPPIPEVVRRRYAENLRAMLWVGLSNTEARLALRPQSSAQWDAFHQDLEIRRGPAGDLHAVAEWITRVRQSTARIAGILHVAKHAGTMRGEAIRVPIDEDTMQRAIEIGQWLVAHGAPIVRGAVGTPTTGRVSLLSLVRSIVAATGTWEGTGEELSAALRRAHSGAWDPGWPTVANQLTRVIRSSDLRAAGLQLVDARTSGRRRLRFSFVEHATEHRGDQQRSSDAEPEGIGQGHRGGGDDDSDDDLGT